jgi:hypothetical protein
MCRRLALPREAAKVTRLCRGRLLQTAAGCPVLHSLIDMEPQ